MAAAEQELLQQLVGQVQALYDSPPGSAPQRQADKWLTGLVGLEGAWPVLLRVVGPTPGEGQASPFDVRLTFIAAKIMQVRTDDARGAFGRFEGVLVHTKSHTQPSLGTHHTAEDPARLAHLPPRHAADGAGDACFPPAAGGSRVIRRNGVDGRPLVIPHQPYMMPITCTHSGAAGPHDAPIVQNQLVLAFVHVLLQKLVETHAATTQQRQQQQQQGQSTTFVMELCRLFGITGAPGACLCLNVCVGDGMTPRGTTPHDKHGTIRRSCVCVYLRPGHAAQAPAPAAEHPEGPPRGAQPPAGRRGRGHGRDGPATPAGTRWRWRWMGSPLDVRQADETAHTLFSTLQIQGGENGGRGGEGGPLQMSGEDAHTVVNLVGSVLERCDAAEAEGLARGQEEAVAASRRAKLAALQCLQAWAMYVMQAPAWVTLGDMAEWGLLPALEGQVALAGTARALEPEAFCTVLAVRIYVCVYVLRGGF